jgi:hypothetical protein
MKPRGSHDERGPVRLLILAADPRSLETLSHRPRE